MIGALNTTCEWSKQSTTNKYGETTYTTPTILPCAIGKNVRLKQTEQGLIHSEELYYILHSAGVQNGDTINGQVVAVSEVKDLRGSTLYYKAVVVDG